MPDHPWHARGRVRAGHDPQPSEWCRPQSPLGVWGARASLREAVEGLFARARDSSGVNTPRRAVNPVWDRGGQTEWPWSLVLSTGASVRWRKFGGAGNSKSKGVRAEGAKLFAGNDFVVVVGIEVWSEGAAVTKVRSAGPDGEESLECFASILQVLGAPKPDVAIKAPEGDSAWLDPGCGHRRGGARSGERVCRANGPPRQGCKRLWEPAQSKWFSELHPALGQPHSGCRPSVHCIYPPAAAAAGRAIAVSAVTGGEENPGLLQSL